VGRREREARPVRERKPRKPRKPRGPRRGRRWRAQQAAEAEANRLAALERWDVGAAAGLLPWSAGPLFRRLVSEGLNGGKPVEER